MLALVSVLRTALLDEVLEVLKCTECKTKCILYIFFTPFVLECVQNCTENGEL